MLLEREEREMEKEDFSPRRCLPGLDWWGKYLLSAYYESSIVLGRAARFSCQWSERKYFRLWRPMASPAIKPPFFVAQKLPDTIHEWLSVTAAAAKSLQSCPTQAPLSLGFSREWVAISFSNEWKWKVQVKTLSCVWLLATPWTAAHQAPPSMGFSRQEYWSWLPLPSPNECDYAPIKLYLQNRGWAGEAQFAH